MRRREFLKVCSLLGLSPTFFACTRSGHDASAARFDGQVLIIGSGAAGLSAAYLLEQRGVDYSVLEASGTFGGRMKQDERFADFPLPLGAEWLHVHESELARITGEPDVAAGTELVGYSGEETVGSVEAGRVFYSSLSDAFGDDSIDQKFVGTTWYGFFRERVLPSVEAKLRFDTNVESIQYGADRVVVTAAGGTKYEADKVIVTVPLKQLQLGAIAFYPELPEDRLRILQRAPVWGGIKAFLAFTERFYPTFLTFSDSETDAGQRLYFDAAHGQRTSMNILGLFAVGEQAKRYQRVSGDEQLRLILRELDEVFEGRATGLYVKHVVQDWDSEPFVQSAYLADSASPTVPRSISRPLHNKLYFAGEAYTSGDDWGGVHNATRSARRAVDAITG